MYLEKASDLGGEATYKEIFQQADVREKVYGLYEERKEGIEAFLKGLGSEVKVIFTGAGTSEYVGNVASEYLKSLGTYDFESVATTDLVSCPYLHFKKDQKTLLVSFARSGNSPESLAAVGLGEQIVDDFYNLAITCAKDGKLAQKLEGDERAYVFLEPEETNDKSFAMTSSFSSMLLTSLLIFDDKTPDKKELVGKLSKLAREVYEDKEEIEDLVDFDFTRIAYLGSGPFYRLTSEASLKILELTAGEIVASKESSMGFRHGPKSIIDENTLLVSFISEDAYTKDYDLDLVREVYGDGVCKKVITISNEKYEEPWDQLVYESQGIKDVYLSLVYVVVAQIIALVASFRVGNTPDAPSRNRTVNRVVKGVIIHDYERK